MVDIHDRNEPLSSVIMVFLYYLSNYQLCKKDLSIPWSEADGTFCNFIKFRLQVKNACYDTVCPYLSTVLST